VFAGLPGLAKALTLQNPPSITAPMAAGAIPPPLFFERRRDVGILARRQWHTQGHPKTKDSLDHAFER
jgi:hypothetical protein